MPEASTLNFLVARRIFAGPPSQDAQARLRRALARGAALAMHAAAIAFLLAHPPIEVRQELPPIQVDLVVMPPSVNPAKTPSPSNPAAQAKKASQESVSGDDPNRVAGRMPAEETKSNVEPAPEPVTAQSRQPAPTEALPAQAVPPAPSSPESVDVESPSPLDTPALSPSAGEVAALGPSLPDLKPSPPAGLPAPTAKPSPLKPAARPLEETDKAQSGEGGGDRYLDEVRQEINRNRTYPAEARALGIAGTAQYAIFIDRQGRLLRLRLLQSSGADMLDEAGMDMIRRSAPFRPPPSSHKGDEVKLVVVLHIGP